MIDIIKSGILNIIVMFFLLLIISISFVFFVLLIMKIFRYTLYSDLQTYLSRINKKKSFFHILGLVLLSNGPATLFFIHLMMISKKSKIPLIPYIIRRVINIISGADISTGATIKEGLQIFHGHGLVIGDGAKVGRNVWLFQNVCLGNNYGGYPTLQDNVVVFQGALIVGDITIGKNSIISANTVVTKNIPENSVVSGQSELIIKPRTK